MLSMVMPALKADLRLYRRYSYVHEPPLNVPIVAYSGDTDPNLQTGHMEAWREQTTSGFTQRVFPGGHFYFNNNLPEFLAALKEDLLYARAEVR